MFGLSLPHLVILGLVVLVLFGKGRISETMGDFGKGIKSFKEGMADDAASRPAPTAPPAAQITAPITTPAQPAQPGVVPADGVGGQGPV